jgi:hypothetical protein
MDHGRASFEGRAVDERDGAPDHDVSEHEGARRRATSGSDEDDMAWTMYLNASRHSDGRIDRTDAHRVNSADLRGKLTKSHELGLPSGDDEDLESVRHARDMRGRDGQKSNENVDPIDRREDEDVKMREPWLLERPVPSTLPMFMRVPLLLVAAVSSSGLIACAVPAPEPNPDSSSSTATAVIAVERTAGPGDATRGDAVIARFVRVRQGSVDDPALRMAGVATDIPAAGSCSVPSDAAPAIQGRPVELLDVGQVTLVGAESIGQNMGQNMGANAGKSTVLLPRLMPDPAAMVSGVFYSSRSADVFVPGARVSLRSAGGPDLAEGFSITATAPREVADVKVLPAATGLDVSWDATEADGHDVVYVDVLSPAPHAVLRCAGTDTGRLVIPQSTIGGIDDGQLVVHRLHKESFRAKGIEPGEVRFDVAKTVAFRR